MSNIDPWKPLTYYHRDQYYGSSAVNSSYQDTYMAPKPFYHENPMSTSLQRAQQAPYMFMHSSLRPPGAF